MQDADSTAIVCANYSLTQADLYKAHVRHAGWSFWALQAIGVVLICAGLFTLALRQYGQGAIALAIGIFFVFRLRLALRAAYRRDFLPVVETTITVSDSGIQFKNAKGHSSLSWNAFVRYTETKELFMLYVQSQIFQMVPKRAFAAEDLAVLQGVLQLKVKRTSGTANLNYRVVLLGLIVLVAFILVMWAVHRTRTMS